MPQSVSRPSASSVLGRSQFLRSPGLARLLDKHVPADQRVLNAQDAVMYVWDLSRKSLKLHDGGLLQTDQALYFFPEGLFGEGAKPFKLNLGDIAETSLGEATFALRFQRGGQYFRWEFEFSGGPELAARCLAAVREARRSSAAAALAQPQARVGDWLRALRRLPQGQA